MLTSQRTLLLLLTLLSLLATSLAASEPLTNQTMIDGPLFDTYQFLSPGIMMALLTVFLLSLIAYVGISALTSLEVTYAAFEKESGPGSKKQQ